MIDNEKRLVERFRSGDEDALGELYELAAARVYRFALRITRNAQDAEDVVVQTFETAYRSRERFREESTVFAWLYRIAFHLCTRVTRRRKSEPMPEAEISDLGSSAQLHAIELEQLISALPESQKAAFLLVRIEGLSYKEAGDVLGKSVGTIQAQVHQASQKLQLELSPLGNGRAVAKEFRYEL